MEASMPLIAPIWSAGMETGARKLGTITTLAGPARQYSLV